MNEMTGEPAAEPQRERPEDHRARAPSLKLGPEGNVFPGLAALGFGVVLLAASLGVFGEAKSEDESPIWLLGTFGYTAAMVGLYLAGGGLIDKAKSWKYRRGHAKYPDEPWRWDYRWSRRGATDEGLGQILGIAVTLTVVASFLALFNYAAYDTWRPEFALIALSGDALLLAGYGYVVLEFVRHLRHRRGAVRFARFPFFLGESVELALKRRGWRGLPELNVTLRCVEESYEGVFQLYSDRQCMKPPRGFSKLDLSFPLPIGGYDTHLTDWPFRYWELRVQGTGARSSYDAVFLLPVYARQE